MSRSHRLLGLCLLAFALVGCAKEDPIPEERDPIYQDLTKREAEHSKMLEEATAKLTETREKLAKVEPLSIEKKDLEKELAKHTAGKLEHEQWAHYYKIRAGRRKVVDRLVYKEAFHAGRDKEWPDPKEYQEYLVNRRLVEVSRNWAQRVPKLQTRVAGKGEGAKKEEKKAESE